MSDWIKTAKVGDRIVAVGSDRGADISKSQAKQAGAILPKIGSIYSIREINDWGGDKIIIRLNEIDNTHTLPKVGGSVEPGFHYSKFRPVQPRKTSIAIFEKLLNSAPADQPMEEETC